MSNNYMCDMCCKYGDRPCVYTQDRSIIILLLHCFLWADQVLLLAHLGAVSRCHAMLHIICSNAEGSSRSCTAFPQLSKHHYTLLLITWMHVLKINNCTSSQPSPLPLDYRWLPNRPVGQPTSSIKFSQMPALATHTNKYIQQTPRWYLKFKLHSM